MTTIGLMIVQIMTITFKAVEKPFERRKNKRFSKIVGFFG
jgi:hypothetical protein